MYEKIKKEKNEALRTVHPDKSTFDALDYTDEIINVLKQEVHSKLIEYFSKYEIDAKTFFLHAEFNVEKKCFCAFKVSTS